MRSNKFRCIYCGGWVKNYNRFTTSDTHYWQWFITSTIYHHKRVKWELLSLLGIVHIGNVSKDFEISSNVCEHLLIAMVIRAAITWALITK